MAFYEYEDKKLDASFYLSISHEELSNYFSNSDFLVMLWNNGAHSLEMLVDAQKVVLHPSHVMFLTYRQKVERIETKAPGLIGLAFNRAFYCVHTHDSETSCNGLLFFGSDFLPVIQLPDSENGRLQTLIHVLREEFETRDGNQEEMLRILLKRFIIRCTRLARVQLRPSIDAQPDLDLIRQFNVLVEEHYKTKRRVSDYAQLLFKSPKTLSNIFRLHVGSSPLKVIHQRVLVEAKRYLFFTDKTIKEISAELGFEEPTQFSKFFKKHLGTTPLEYKLMHQRTDFGKY
jgi:AraC-like DNA-binding protein